MKRAAKKKPKLTLDRLSRTIQQDFSGLRTRLGHVEANMATRDDLHQMKADIVEEVRKENHKVLVSNDKVVTRLDRLLNEDAAHTERHRRIDDRLDTHEERIGRIERVRG
jgi:regulator of replication initiation timing